MKLALCTLDQQQYDAADFADSDPTWTDINLTRGRSCFLPPLRGEEAVVKFGRQGTRIALQGQKIFRFCALR
jgi:hypothetical protein